jgi:Kef-type K+ transport system membrane component KefB
MAPVALSPEAVLGFVLLDIAIILVVARIMGGLMTRIGQPRVVGEIVAGVLLGPSLLGPTLLEWNGSWSFLQCDRALAAAPAGTLPSISQCVFPPQARGILGVVGQIALVFFMFLVGLELDFERLRGKTRPILLVAVGAIATPVAVGWLIGPRLFDEKWLFPGAEIPRVGFYLFLGALLSVTAFPVMARILQEKGLTQSPMGATGIAAAAVVTVLMFLLVAVATGVSTGDGAGADLLLTFSAAGVYLAVMAGVVRPLLRRIGRLYEEDGLTNGIFASILIGLFVSAYVAHTIGINVIVGGFMLGAVLPARAGLFRDMSARLGDLTAVVLLPIFLAFSGLNTDFTKLGRAFIPGIALLLVAAVASKWAGSAVSARLGGLSWAEGNVIGVLMNCRGLLVLVIGLIGVQQEIISPQLQVAAVVVALVTTMMTGPLFDRFVSRLSDDSPTPAGARLGLVDEQQLLEEVSGDR